MLIQIFLGHRTCYRSCRTYSQADRQKCIKCSWSVTTKIVLMIDLWFPKYFVFSHFSPVFLPPNLLCFWKLDIFVVRALASLGWTLLCFCRISLTPLPTCLSFISCFSFLTFFSFADQFSEHKTDTNEIFRFETLTHVYENSKIWKINIFNFLIFLDTKNYNTQVSVSNSA